MAKMCPGNFLSVTPDSGQIASVIYCDHCTFLDLGLVYYG